MVQRITEGIFEFDDKVIWDKESKQLISKLLNVNPQDRPTARDCCANPWFASSS
jgi:serine/threonine protein kinase